jgi:hypothetical protein
MDMMLQLLDLMLSLAHLTVIGFNLCGWIWPRTRRWHRWSVGLTASSWFLLGWWYGWGYCLLTDWQWQVKRKLGETELPASFIKYAADRITGLDFDAGLVDTITLVLFLVIIGLTLYFAMHDYIAGKASSAA